MLQQVLNCAREQLGSTLHSRKQAYDRKVNVDTYDVGDLVYLLNSAGKIGQSRKLQPIYTGPHLIVKKISDILFATINSRGKQQITHHDRMRRCSDHNIPIWARRERARLQQDIHVEAEEVTDWSLPRLFQEEGEKGDETPASDAALPEQLQTTTEEDEEVASELPGNSATPDSYLPGTVAPTPEQTDNILPVPDNSLSLPPSKRSGRQRRRPYWLRDFITQRGTQNAHN